MSAVLADLRDRPAIAPSLDARPWASRHVAAFARDWRATAGMESLILERCARTIASAARRGAVLVDAGGACPTDLRVLWDALDAPAALIALEQLSHDRAWPCGGPAGQRIVFVPSATTACLAPSAIGALLRRIGAWAGADALLVVGTREQPIDARMASGFSLPHVDALAENAGWTLTQRWTDAHARHALHVLERAG